MERRLKLVQHFKMEIILKFHKDFINLKCVGIHFPTLLNFNRPNIENPLFKGFLGQELRGL